MLVNFEKIHLYRKQRKITNKGFCELCEIGRTTLWDWEHGKSTPSEDKIRKIAKVLGVSSTDISDLAPEYDLPEKEYNKSVKETVSNWLNLLYEDNSTTEIDEIKLKLVNVENKLNNGSVIIRALMMSLQAIFYIKDVNLKYVIANEAFLDNVALNKNYNVIGKIDDDFFPIKEAKENEEEDREVLLNGKSIVNREDYIPGSRKKKWGMFSKYPIISSNGKPIGVIAMINDVTEYRVAAKKRILLENAIDHLDDVSVSIGQFSHKKEKEFIFEYMNSTMRKIFSIESPEDYRKIPELWSRMLPEESRFVYEKRRTVKHFPAHFVYKAIRPYDNKKVWLQDSIYKSEDRLISIVRDITELKAAEEKRICLEDSLNKLEECVWIAKKEDGLFQYNFINDSIHDFTGISKEEFYKESTVWQKCIKKVDLPTVEAFRRTKEYPKVAEYRLVNERTKQERIINESIYKYGNTYIGFIKDVKEKKENEKMRELLEFYIQRMSSGFAIINIGTQKFEYMNEEFSKIFNVSQEKLYEMGAGSWFIKYIHPDDRVEKLTLSDLKSKNRQKNVRAIIDGGDIKFLSVRSEIEKFSKKLCIIISIEDVTDHAKLVNQIESFQFIFDTVPASITLLDYKTGKCLYTNNRVKEIFGYSFEQIFDMDFWLENVVHPDERALHESYKVNNNFPHSRVYRIVKPDGSVHKIKNNHVVKEHNGRKYIVLTNSVIE